MFPLQWLVLVLVPLAVAQPAPPACCATKTVGGVSYTFVREDSAAMSYSCLSSCVYERDDQPGSAFCFAQGDQQVVCGDSTQGTTTTTTTTTTSTSTTTTTTTTTEQCQCGVKGARNRIVGGDEATPGEWPWIVVLSYAPDGSNMGSCGGTLIADQWVLTAAHCVDRWRSTDISAVINEHRIYTDPFNSIQSPIDEDDNNLGRRVLELEEIRIHPQYDSGTLDFDIALLKLDTALNLFNYTPACLPERNVNFVGDTAWVYGWGRYDNGHGRNSDVLRETTVQVISNQECNQTQHWHGSLPSQLCAWTAGQDSCNGDSGGPLTLEQDGRHILIGVVSFGDDNCGGSKAGVYNDVSNLRAWIDTTMENNGGATLCD